MRPTRIPAAAAVWAALLTWLPVSGAQDGTTAAGAASSSSSECARPAQRREWRTLSRDDQAAYVAAVKCLATKPSSMGLPTSLYEDFTWVHWHLNDDIHFVAQFLPWHRWFVHQYEQALRDACAYAGHMVYWDWTQDSGALPSAPVFSADPATGFGTDVPPGPGRSSASLTWCLQDGAFADLQLTYFDGRRREHCLNRRLNNGTNRWPDEKRWRASRYSAAAVERLTDEGTWFSEFAPALERRPHAAIHDTLGGDMGPMRTSPNDPLFFLHHAQVDRLWWRWQQRRRRPGTDGDDDARARDRDDYEGRRYPDDARQPASAALDDPMPMMRLNGADDVPVRDVMSTRQGPLCYEYV